VLIVENDDVAAQLLTHQLEDLGCDVDRSFDGPTGLERALEGTAWSLIVLERNLPDLDGLQICRLVRASASYPSILMLSMQCTEFDRVLGLESGADDYLAKPISIIEFAARVKAILRRVEHLANQSSLHQRTLRSGALEINFDQRVVRREGCELDLTVKEFELLVHLVRHPLQVFTRAQLLDQVWGASRDAFEHTVNSHINRLRAKVEPDPRRPQYIGTVWGVGYKLCTVPDPSQSARGSWHGALGQQRGYRADHKNGGRYKTAHPGNIARQYDNHNPD
jgi:DNA-binding response OmpR family regulator